MKKSIIIIGAGMGGLAAGIYGQKAGVNTQIFESHFVPGGQCTSFKRKGYTFDLCIHHFIGNRENSATYELWKELGAMEGKFIPTRECVSVLSPEGRVFNDYYDLQKLEEHMLALAPEDAKVIRDYLEGIKAFSKLRFFDSFVFGSTGKRILKMLKMLPVMKYMKPTMSDYAGRFTNPFLKRAFALLEYSITDFPLMAHLGKKVEGLHGNIGWPEGGAVAFASSIAGRYEELGGNIHYKSKVVKILTENDRAVGVELEDGTKHYADVIISNADGRKTILDMLGGRYMDKKLKAWCAPPDADEPRNWGVHLHLGVNRDLSDESSALVMLLDKPVTIAGHENHSIELQTYGFDPSMAPPGKGVIKVELVSPHSFWSGLSKERYKEEKEKIVAQVVPLLEKAFPGISKQVEVTDVSTLLTWERYMGGTMGFCNMPAKKFDLISSFFGKNVGTLPGLKNFYLTGVWATSAGALMMNAYSGKMAIKEIMKKG